MRVRRREGRTAPDPPRAHLVHRTPSGLRVSGPARGKQVADHLPRPEARHGLRLQHRHEALHRGRNLLRRLAPAAEAGAALPLRYVQQSEICQRPVG